MPSERTSNDQNSAQGIGVERVFNIVGCAAAGATTLFLLWLLLSTGITEARITGAVPTLVVGAVNLFAGFGAILGAAIGGLEKLQ